MIDLGLARIARFQRKLKYELTRLSMEFGRDRFDLYIYTS
jgi:hypothetical protein